MPLQPLPTRPSPPRESLVQTAANLQLQLPLRTFSPPCAHTSPTVRGFLHCRDIALSHAGTALWIQPRAACTAHLTGFDVHSSFTQVTDGMNPDFQHPDDVPLNPGNTRAQKLTSLSGPARNVESLCVVVFAGPLQRCHPAVQMARTKTLCVQ